MLKRSGYDGIAHWYDTYVQTSFDIPFFTQEAKKASDVLELMCGTGRVSLPLIQAGIRLTCVDRSAEMLVVLRNKLSQTGLSAQVVQADICDLQLGKRFDLIILPFLSFAEIASQEDQRRALARIRDHMSPGGRFICTLRNAAVGGPPDGTLRLFSQHALADGVGILLFWMVNHMDAQDARVVDALELFEAYDAAGVLKEKRMLELRYRLMSKAEFEVLADSAGFRTVALYGDYAYREFVESTSPFMIWVFEARPEER